VRTLYIVGAGGFGAEVEWLVDQLGPNTNRFLYRVMFVNQLLDNPDYSGPHIHCGLPVVSGMELEKELHTLAKKSVTIAIGDPESRRKAYAQLPEMDIDFPVLIHPSVEYDSRVNRVFFGRGTIVCAGSILTTNIQIGEFVHINLDCTIGHDAEIGNFCTLSPGVHISGKVHIGNDVFLGTGAVVLPGIEIGSGSKVGAGAVVIKNVPPHTTVVGIPAKPTK